MFLTRRFYLMLAAVTVLVASGYWIPPMYAVGGWAALLSLLAVVADVALLWSRRGVDARRECSERFSNGDDNRVLLRLASDYPFRTALEVTDELPFIFQRRDVGFRVRLQAKGRAELAYVLHPVRRGTYGFGHIRVFAMTPLALVQRRYTLGTPCDVKVYPSYLRLRHYELHAMSHRLTEAGARRVRRIGHNTEFEQIKDYVQGDDYRTINWKATARRAQLMTNVYQEERSQQVVSIIDKGRMMQQAFEGMTLLDHAINASLVLSYVAVSRDDRAGLATFSAQFDTFVTPSRRPGHMQALMEALYGEQTSFGESDFSALVTHLEQRLSKRSLLILYTHFLGIQGLHRSLPYLRQLALRHRLLVVFFEDEELRGLIRQQPATTEDYYQHVIAEKYAYEQRLIVQTLRQYGIQSLLTVPSRLSADVINRYLDLRLRG